jgi:hypothetical protein
MTANTSAGEEEFDERRCWAGTNGVMKDRVSRVDQVLQVEQVVQVEHARRDSCGTRLTCLTRLTRDPPDLTDPINPPDLSDPSDP